MNLKRKLAEKTEHKKINFLSKEKLFNFVIFEMNDFSRETN